MKILPLRKCDKTFRESCQFINWLPMNGRFVLTLTFDSIDSCLTAKTILDRSGESCSCHMFARVKVLFNESKNESVNIFKMP